MKLQHKELNKKYFLQTTFLTVMQNRKISPSRNIRQVNGFFIEAGAGDGEIISNTLYFELLYKVVLILKSLMSKQMFLYFL